MMPVSPYWKQTVVMKLYYRARVLGVKIVTRYRHDLLWIEVKSDSN